MKDSPGRGRWHESARRGARWHCEAMTERTRMLTKSKKHSDTISVCQRHRIAVFLCFILPGLPSQALTRQLSQRESHWQTGSLQFRRLTPAIAQKIVPCYRGKQGTTVFDINKLCSFYESLSDTPVPLPLGATATTAASGGSRESLLGPRPARRKRSAADAGCRNPGSGTEGDGEGYSG